MTRHVLAWLDERLDDLRAATRFHLLAEHLARIARGGVAGTQALGRVRENLRTLLDQYPDWETILVSDARGRAVASAVNGA